MGEAKRRQLAGAATKRVRYPPGPVKTSRGWVWLDERGVARTLRAGGRIPDRLLEAEARELAGPKPAA